MMTVLPANSTVRPAVSSAERAACCGSGAADQFAAVAGEQQQRVVDAHAYADQDHQRDGVVGHSDHMRGQDHQPDGAAGREHRDDDGDARGQQRTEQQHQDGQGGEQPGALGGPAGGLFRAPDGVAAQFDPQASAPRVLGGVDDGPDVGTGNLFRLPVEHECGVGDRPVAGDRPVPYVWAVDTGHARQLCHLAQHRGDPLPCFGRADPVRVGHHDLHHGAGLARGVLFQRVKCLLGLGARKRVVVVVVAARRAGGDGDSG
jgi:hypothetical protein